MPSDNDLRLLERAIEAAKLCRQRFKHCAIVVKSGNILSVAVNTFRNDPSLCGVNRAASYHAEVNALRMVSEKASIGSRIYVVRYGNNGNIAMSRPCNECHSYIISRGVKKVIYSISDNEYCTERIVKTLDN